MRYNEPKDPVVICRGWILPEAFMTFFGKILDILTVKMETPQPYGWFHLLFFALSIAAGIALCLIFKNPDSRTVRRILLTVSVLVVVLEVYKQIVYTFSYDGAVVTGDFQWYAFPFQFCSMPMYVGFLAGCLKKGRVHNALCAFLVTYSMFAGLSVMCYPVQVFIPTIGINVQTMICHGSMITLGIFLVFSGYVKMSLRKTLLPAMTVFGICVCTAVIMNEVVYYSGIAGGETFNMFFVSRHFPPSLPVYSLVQEVVPYPWCLFLYVIGFSVAAFLILGIMAGIRALILRISSKKKNVGSAC